MPSLTWIDEVADWPNPSWEKYYNKMASHVGLSTPKEKSKPLVAVPLPRWRRELRQATRLAAPTGQGGTSVLSSIELDPIDPPSRTFRLRIDGVRWRGTWAMMDMNLDHHVQHFQSFNSFAQVQMKPSTLTLRVMNMDMPGQSVTFELTGRWNVSHDQDTGRLTIDWKKPPETKPTKPPMASW